MSLLLLLRAPEAGEAAITAEILETSPILDTLIRATPTELRGRKWHGIWAGTGDGTPTGWTHSEGETFSTARWWASGFPGPAFLGLTAAERLTTGQELKFMLLDDKVGNCVEMKMAYNTAERYFVALIEEDAEENEIVLWSGFVPRVAGDRFYLSVEEGSHGIRAWRQTPAGSPTVFGEGTLAIPFSSLGKTADIKLYNAGGFRGTDFTAGSLNPDPPIEQKAAPSTLVSLQYANWGEEANADLAAAVSLTRFDTDLGVEVLQEVKETGLKIHMLFSGPYDEGGVSALNPDEWVADVLAFYEDNVTPAEAPIVEVLNEPGGFWFWGAEASSAANSLAYRVLVQKTYEAFHAKYGSAAPKIIATVEGKHLQFGEQWWTPECANFVDGIVLHPYGGTGDKAESALGNRTLIEEARELTGMPIYVTEIGWPTAIEEEPTGDSLQWTEAEQAANIKAFITWARHTGYIAQVNIFAFHDFGTQTWYGVVRLDGSHKPAYDALKAAATVGLGSVRVREPVPMRQYLLITTPGGKTYRWGEDEPVADRVFEDLNDSDSVPGGCKELSCSLPRKPGIDYADVKRGSHVELFGAGQRKGWEGTLQDAPRTSGDKLVLAPAAVGYQDDLSLDESVQCIPIDADLSGWGEPSAARVAAAPGEKINQDGQVTLLPPGDPAGGGVPAISHSFAHIDNAGGTIPDWAESTYDGLGVELGRVLLDFVAVKGLGAGWVDELRAMSDDVESAGELLKDFGGATALAQSFAIAAGRRFLRIRDRFAPTANEDFNSEAQWRNLRIQDRSGIPLYGTWPNVGVLFSDIVAYLLARWCPRIKFTTGPNGSIKPSSFPIPHLVAKEATTAKDVIEQGARFELPEWAIWPGQFGPTMYVNQRGQRPGRKRWRVRMREANFEDTGPAMSRICNGLVIQWEDTDGTTKLMGPPGSGLRLTSEACVDRDPLNPANQLGIRKWPKIAMKRKATNLGAEETCRRYFEQIKLLDGSGRMSLTGLVEDEHGHSWPYTWVESGDLVLPLDASDNSDRYVVDCARSRSGRTASISLDAPPDSYEAMMERLDVEELAAGL